MSWGEGAMWEPTQSNPMCEHDGDVDFALTAEVGQEEKVGVVRIKAENGDTFAKLAAKLADEWNNKNPIKGIFAVALLEGIFAAKPPGPMTAFFSTEPYASEDIEMEVTFPAHGECLKKCCAKQQQWQCAR